MKNNRRSTFFRVAALCMSILCASTLLASCQDSQSENVSPETAAPVELAENVTEITRADLNGNGDDEIIAADVSGFETDGNATLLVFSSDGAELIYSEDANSSHAGWNALYLYEDGETTALLRYLPQLSTGIGTYGYTLFNFDTTNKVNVIASGNVDFQLMGLVPLDASGMAEFASDVNRYLANCDTLLSTWNGELTYGTGGMVPGEDYSIFLMDSTELYSDGDTLEQQLQKYSDNRLAELNSETDGAAQTTADGQMTADEWKAGLNTDFGFREPEDVTQLSDEELGSYMSDAYFAAADAFGWFNIDSSGICGKKIFDSSTEATVEINGIPYNKMYNPVFATLGDLETYLKGLFSSEIADQLLSTGMFIDNEGELWGAMAARGTNIFVETTGYAVTSRSDTEIIYTAYANINNYDDAAEDFVLDHTESYDYTYSLTDDGWRWTDFSLYY